MEKQTNFKVYFANNLKLVTPVLQNAIDLASEFLGISSDQLIEEARLKSERRGKELFSFYQNGSLLILSVKL